MQRTVPPMATGRAGIGGFTYLGLLLFIAIAGIGLAVVGEVWHTEAQREREKELLFVGEQYAKAIGSYYESTPSGPKQYPASLQDLLLDNRFPDIRRHLRKLYRDPVTGDDKWGLTKDQGRITGVYSLSRLRPLKTKEFPSLWTAFAAAKNYDAWQFVYIPVAVSSAQPLPQEPATSSSVRPVQAAPESSVASAPASNPNPPISDADRSKKQACLGQRATDSAACSHYCKGDGPAPGCSLCMASVASRYRACLNEVDPPALYDGN